MTAPEVNMACKDRFSGAFLDLFGRKPVSEPAVKFKHAGEISVAAIPSDHFCGCFCIGGSGAAQDAALPGSRAITRQIICAGLLQGGIQKGRSADQGDPVLFKNGTKLRETGRDVIAIQLFSLSILLKQAQLFQQILKGRPLVSGNSAVGRSVRSTLISRGTITGRAHSLF